MPRTCCVHKGRGRRSRQDQHRGDRLRPGSCPTPPAVRAAQGVPPAQGAYRAGRRRIWRGPGPGHARGHPRRGSHRRRYLRRARHPDVQGVRPQPDGSVAVDGSVPIRDLNRAMELNLPDEEATTIAGLVIHEARIIPEPTVRPSPSTGSGFRSCARPATASPPFASRRCNGSRRRWRRRVARHLAYARVMPGLVPAIHAFKVPPQDVT